MSRFVYAVPSRAASSSLSGSNGRSSRTSSKASRIRSVARRNTCRNSASFVPNVRTTYGWETPASRATASVLVPW